MIERIILMLELNEFYGVSENIEIAKGRNQLTTNVKDKTKQAKRIKEWQSRKQ